MQTDETTWLTRRQLSKLLGLSERTILTLTRSGQLPGKRIGARAIRYSLADVQRAIDAMPSAARDPQPAAAC